MTGFKVGGDEGKETGDLCNLLCAIPPVASIPHLSVKTFAMVMFVMSNLQLSRICDCDANI